MLIFGSLKVHIINLKFAQTYRCYGHYSDTVTEDQEQLWDCCGIYAFVSLKTPLRAFMCTMGDPHRRLRATQAPGKIRV